MFVQSHVKYVTFVCHMFESVVMVRVSETLNVWDVPDTEHISSVHVYSCMRTGTEGSQIATFSLERTVW